jgi:hypothetical protein
MAAPQGLLLADVVNVTIDLSPLAAGYRNFGALLMMGSTEGVIDTAERMRLYTELQGVAEDFGSLSAEYLGAVKFFSQAPRPNLLYIGRWAQDDTHGLLHMGVLQAHEQLMSEWTGITNGSFTVSIDGVEYDITAVNFSAATNLNGVASILQAKVAAVATGSTVKWDSVSQRFTLTSGTTGAASTVSYMTPVGSGTDLSAKLHGTFGTASVPVGGQLAETALEAAIAAADRSGDWYGLTFATAVPPSDDDYLDVASYIEGSAQDRVFGVTITNSTVLDPIDNTDLGSQFKTLGLERTFSQYSEDPFAVSSLYGRMFTVNFEAENQVITLKFKQEPVVAPELLTESQASTLKKKNVNVFVRYQNDLAIVQEGVMANGAFIDEVHGTDWLKNRIQVDLFNRLYQAPKKVPQTDDGIHSLVTTVEASCAQAVVNGLVAPGVWQVAGFGQLKQGDTLTKGYYVYAPPVGLQPQADRERRKSPPIQVAAKLAGAVHSVDVLVTVNR